MIPKFDELIEQLPFVVNGYEFNSMIGLGDNACVFKVVQNSTGNKFAAKVFHLNSCENTHNSVIKSKILDMSLMHPNIVKIFDYFRKGCFLFLVVELCEKGSIGNIILRGTKLPERKVLLIMKQLLKALYYCHSQGFAHGNIKLSNVLISSSGIIKLTDFKLDIHSKSKRHSKNLSSLIYKAPELIAQEEFTRFKTDIWSLGVVFYYIATGTLPWGTAKENIEGNILNGNYNLPDDTPASISYIISKMLVVDQSKRATVEELLNIPYFISVEAFSLPTVCKVNIERLPFLHSNTRKMVNTKKQDNQNLIANSFLPLLSNYNKNKKNVINNFNTMTF